MTLPMPEEVDNWTPSFPLKAIVLCSASSPVPSPFVPTRLFVGPLEM
jgi:hypothetical protein